MNRVGTGTDPLYLSSLDECVLNAGRQWEGLEKMTNEQERIYVASSWRNAYHAAMVATCRAARFEVYDFKDSEGFNWKEVDPEWQKWDYEAWERGLLHERAEQGFKRDMDALERADRCILVLPSGRSAHLEAGYAIGKGKPTAIWVPEFDTPDLMVKMADYVSDSLMNILEWLGVED